MRKLIVSTDKGILEYEIIDELVFIHVVVHRWSKDIYQEFLATWRKVLDKFNDTGVEYVYCMIPSDDTKLIKFEKMFGFQELLERDGVLIMLRSTKKWA